MSVEAVLGAIAVLQVMQTVQMVVLIRGMQRVSKTVRPGPMLDPELATDLRQIAQLATLVLRKDPDAAPAPRG